jgi:hypothetical protein
MGYVGYVKLITREYKAMFIIGLALIIGTLFHIYYDYEGFFHILKLVLANDDLRGNFSVGESYPMLFSLSIINKFGSSTVLLFLIAFSLLIYAVFKPKDKLLQLTILLLLYIRTYLNRIYHFLYIQNIF